MRCYPAARINAKEAARIAVSPQKLDQPLLIVLLGPIKSTESVFFCHRAEQRIRRLFARVTRIFFAFLVL